MRTVILDREHPSPEVHAGAGHDTVEVGDGLHNSSKLLPGTGCQMAASWVKVATPVAGSRLMVK